MRSPIGTCLDTQQGHASNKSSTFPSAAYKHALGLSRSALHVHVSLFQAVLSDGMQAAAVVIELTVADVCSCFVLGDNVGLQQNMRKSVPAQDQPEWQQSQPPTHVAEV